MSERRRQSAAATLRNRRLDDGPALFCRHRTATRSRFAAVVRRSSRTRQCHHHFLAPETRAEAAVEEEAGCRERRTRRSSFTNTPPRAYETTQLNKIEDPHLAKNHGITHY
jgi:hypothetical protein